MTEETSVKVTEFPPSPSVWTYESAPLWVGGWKLLTQPDLGLVKMYRTLERSCCTVWSTMFWTSLETLNSYINLTSPPPSTGLFLTISLSLSTPCLYCRYLEYDKRVSHAEENVSDPDILMLFSQILTILSKYKVRENAALHSPAHFILTEKLVS